jgi:hypothetical protein
MTTVRARSEKVKVLVAIKRVVDANGKVGVKADGTGVDTSNVKMSTIPKFRRVHASAFLRARASRGHSRVHATNRGQREFIDIPSIHIARPIFYGCGERRRFGIHCPARDACTVVDALDFRLHIRGNGFFCRP